jgi:heme-degrading monooxygenase HmoA
MGMLVIHHQVKDFSSWKQAYDKHADARKAAGLTRDHVLQSVDDRNAVTVVLDFADLSKAKAFAASADLKAAMKSAGVVGTPVIHILKKVT